MEALGLVVEIPATGCCGMAGLFGHKEAYQQMSRTTFDLSWKAFLNESDPVAATGYSCRCQAQRLSNSHPRHPLGLIADSLA